MKRIIYSAILFLATLTTLSCELDKLPKTQLGAGNVSTFADLEGVRNAAYGCLLTVFSGSYNYYPDYYADLYTELSTSGNRGGNFSKWSLTSFDADVTDIWNGYYTVIAQTNFFLDKVDDIRNNCTAEEADAIDVYKGEMYLMRAICFRMLAQRFCVDYEPATASTAMGVPVVTTFDPNAKPSRGSLADTYGRITKDIAEAKALLVTEGSADAIYLTADALTAFEAQVALDMHEWSAASNAASSLYASYPLAESADDLEKMWRRDTSSETIFQPLMTKTTLTGRNTDLHAGEWNAEKNTYECNVAFIPEAWVCSLFADGDWRVGPYVDRQIMLGMNNQGDADVTAILLTKLRGNIDLQNTATNLNWYNMPKVFRVAEMYLIDAEAKYRSGGDALAPLNTLREHRGLPAVSVAGDELFEEIRNERTRELIGEGARLGDLKRWGLGFKRDVQSETVEGGTLKVVAPTYSRMEVAAGEPKLVWPIPGREFQTNENMAGQQNDGWKSN